MAICYAYLGPQPLMALKIRSLSSHGRSWRVKFLSKVVWGIHKNILTPHTGLLHAYLGPQPLVALKIGSLSSHGRGWSVMFFVKSCLGHPYKHFDIPHGSVLCIPGAPDPHCLQDRVPEPPWMGLERGTGSKVVQRAIHTIILTPRMGLYASHRR